MTQLPLPSPVCEVCGTATDDAPIKHTICHAQRRGERPGCGHPLKDHSDGLKCRVCGVECGMHPSRQ